MLLAVVPMLALFVVFCFLAIAGSEQRTLEKTCEKRAQALASTVAAVCSDQMAAKKSPKMDEIMARIGHFTDVSSVAVVDNKLRIKWHTDENKVGTNYHNSGMKGASSEKTLYTNIKNQRCVLVAVPIRVNDTVKGYSVAVISLRGIEQSMRQTRRSMAGLALVLLSGCLLVVVYLSYTFGNPLLLLASVANAYSRGDFTARITQPGCDEAGLAARSLNAIGDYVSRTLEAENERNQNQRARIKELRDFADGVMSGDFSDQAKVQDLDEIGQLAMTLNEMVRYMRGLVEEERVQRAQLADSLKLLSDLEGKEFTIESLEAAAAAKSSYKDPPSRRLKRAVDPNDEETIISMAAPAAPPKRIPPELAETLGDTITTADARDSALKAQAAQAVISDAQADDDSFAISLGSAGELNTLQQQYVNQFTKLGAGQTALVATSSGDVTYPFLRNMLEAEGFSVIHASTVGELLDIATVIAPQLIVVEFNDVPNGNQVAINKLRSTKECCKTSVIVLETNAPSNAAYAVMNDVLPVIIPDSDEDLYQMIREALAEILLVGGANPFVTQGRKRKPKTFR